MKSSPPADYTASIRPSVPADLAFRTIADLEGYATWNTFTPEITPSTSSSPSASSASSSSPLPKASQTTQLSIRTYPIGTPIVLKVKTLLPFPIIQRERITRWDLDSKEIAWSQATLPRWALWTDRTQRVREVESGAEADRNGPTGEAGCEYVTTMVSGLPGIQTSHLESTLNTRIPFVSVRRSEDHLLPSSDCSWADEFNEPWSFVLRIFTTSSAELLASCPHPSYHECELGDLSPTFTTFRRP
jgi:hypothetical protein